MKIIMSSAYARWLISMHRRAALNVISLLPKISLSRAFERYSAAITKRAGEIGSPCLSPRDDLKKPEGAPLMRTENQHEPMQRSISEIQASGNPIHLRTLSRNGHWTRS